MDHHCFKLTSVEVFDHPRREQYCWLPQTIGERQRLIVDIEPYTRPECIELSCHAIGKRLQLGTDECGTTRYNPRHEQKSYRPHAKCAEGDHSHAKKQPNARQGIPG